LAPDADYTLKVLYNGDTLAQDTATLTTANPNVRMSFELPLAIAGDETDPENPVTEPGLSGLAYLSIVGLVLFVGAIA
jgi:hypothetical protein